MAPLLEVFFTLNDQINELVTTEGRYQFSRNDFSVPSTEWVELVKKAILAVRGEANTGEGESLPTDGSATLEKGLFGTFLVSK